YPHADDRAEAFLPSQLQDYGSDARRGCGEQKCGGRKLGRLLLDEASDLSLGVIASQHPGLRVAVLREARGGVRLDLAHRMHLGDPVVREGQVECQSAPGRVVRCGARTMRRSFPATARMR